MGVCAQRQAGVEGWGTGECSCTVPGRWIRWLAPSGRQAKVVAAGTQLQAPNCRQSRGRQAQRGLCLGGCARKERRRTGCRCAG